MLWIALNALVALLSLVLGNIFMLARYVPITSGNRSVISIVILFIEPKNYIF